MSTKFNGIRKLRNRIFHHESITWSVTALENYQREIIEGINWLDKELINWSGDIFRFEQVIKNRKDIIR